MSALEVDLWAHQVEALSFVDHVAKGHALLGMDMGTGKTLTAIKAVASRPDIRGGRHRSALSTGLRCTTDHHRKEKGPVRTGPG